LTKYYKSDILVSKNIEIVFGGFKERKFVSLNSLKTLMMKTNFLFKKFAVSFVTYFVITIITLSIITALLFCEPVIDWILSNQSALIVIGIIAGVLIFFKKQVMFLFNKEH